MDNDGWISKKRKIMGCEEDRKENKIILVENEKCDICLEKNKIKTYTKPEPLRCGCNLFICDDCESELFNSAKLPNSYGEYKNLYRCPWCKKGLIKDENGNIDKKLLLFNGRNMGDLIDWFNKTALICKYDVNKNKEEFEYYPFKIVYNENDYPEYTEDEHFQRKFFMFFEYPEQNYHQFEDKLFIGKLFSEEIFKYVLHLTYITNLIGIKKKIVDENGTVIGYTSVLNNLFFRNMSSKEYFLTGQPGYYLDPRNNNTDFNVIKDGCVEGSFKFFHSAARNCQYDETTPIIRYSLIRKRYCLDYRNICSLGLSNFSMDENNRIMELSDELRNFTVIDHFYNHVKFFRKKKKEYEAEEFIMEDANAGIKLIDKINQIDIYLERIKNIMRSFEEKILSVPKMLLHEIYWDKTEELLFGGYTWYLKTIKKINKKKYATLFHLITK